MKYASMNCSSCGAPLVSAQRFCTKCGSPAGVGPQANPFQLIKSGVSDKMIQLANGEEPGTPKSKFTELDDQVVIWVNVKKVVPGNSQVDFCWYSPDGSLYNKNSLTVRLPGPTLYLTSYHKIRDTSMAQRFGRWKVEIYNGSMKLDIVYFQTSKSTEPSTEHFTSTQHDDTQSPIRGRFCGECGSRVDNSDKFCRSCGAATATADNIQTVRSIPFPTSSNVPQSVTTEAVVDGFSSTNLLKPASKTIGYGVFVTDRRIIGVKKGMLTQAAAGTAAGAVIGGLIGGRIGAQVGASVLGKKMSSNAGKPLLVNLESNKDFEAYKQDIEYFEIKKPGLASQGNLTIWLKTGQPGLVLVFNGDDTYGRLNSMLQSFMPQGVRLTK